MRIRSGVMIKFHIAIFMLILPCVVTSAFNQKASDEQKKAEALKKVFTQKSTAPGKDVGYNVPVQGITIALDSKGYPTLDGVRNLMINEFFPSKKASVQEVNVVLARGGNYHDRLYSVQVKQGNEFRSVFFLKISSQARAGSSERLIKIQSGKIGRIGLTKYYNDSNPLFRRYLPIIVWLEKIYFYKDAQGVERFMELSHAAQGEQVATIINTGSLEKVLACGYYVGRALSSFQQVFIQYVNKNNPETWLTVAHGDFHGGNIFFDEKTEKVYFIDNETMEENRGVFVDPINLFGSFKLDAFYEEDLTGLRFRFSFLKGYLETYPAAQRCKMAPILLGNVILPPVARKINTIDFLSFDAILSNYKFFMSQYIDSVKSYIMNPALSGISCGTSNINTSVYQGDYAAVQSAPKDVLNKFDQCEVTPLFWALEKNDRDMLTLLKLKGVDILQKTTLFPRGVLEYFVLLDHDKVLKSFIDKMKPSQEILEQLLMKASLFGSVNTVKMLLHAGVNINAVSNEFHAKLPVTPLYCAVAREEVGVVEVLLHDKHIDVNVLDVLGRNPLLKLAMHEHHGFPDNNANTIARMLIEAGSDISLKNRKGKTVFDLKPAWEKYQKAPVSNVKNVPLNSHGLLIDALELASLCKRK